MVKFHIQEIALAKVKHKVQFKLKDKSEIMVTCTVFSKEYKETWNVGNTLSVSAHSKTFSNYLLNEAYQ